MTSAQRILESEQSLHARSAGSKVDAVTAARLALAPSASARSTQPNILKWLDQKRVQQLARIKVSGTRPANRTLSSVAPVRPAANLRSSTRRASGDGSQQPGSQAPSAVPSAPVPNLLKQLLLAVKWIETKGKARFSSRPASVACAPPLGGRASVAVPAAAAANLLKQVFSALKWIEKKRMQQFSSRRMKVTETVSLGEKRFVTILQVDGAQLLIGGAAGQVSLLAVLDQQQQSWHAAGTAMEPRS